MKTARRLDASSNPLLDALLVLLPVAVFVVDLLLPLGVTVWVGYLGPIALSLFTPRRQRPLQIAALTTGLAIIGMLVSSTGSDPTLAVLNRGMGILVFWLVAIMGHRFVQARATLTHRERLERGRSELGLLVQGEADIEALGKKVLGFLTDFLGAHVGAFYVADEGATSLTRIAGFALDPASAPPARIEAGEGLVGQAAAENRTFHLDEVPAQYLRVSSGVGSSQPRQVLVVPLAFEGSVEAVIELGFLREVAGPERDLLAAAGEPVAVGLRASKYRTRLEALLSETQQQAEELQAQQEELRAGNAELEAQRNALSDSQVRLQAQHAELEEVNVQLEHQAELLAAQKDDLERAQATLAAKADELARANRYKSEFLANMSHELRTPLNSLLILAKLLSDNREGNLTEEQVRFADTIYGAGNDLLVLINDILDLAKIEAGRVDLHLERIAVTEVVAELERTFGPVARERGLALVLDVRPEAPEALTTDLQRLRQVLKNLLSNALKFTEHGEVRLEVVADSAGRVGFVVRDTGPGIARDQHELIFQAFRQADGQTTRKHGGTGLGLSISRDLARLLGGEVTLVSEVGRGSAFALTIPVNGPELAPEASRPVVVTPPVVEASTHAPGRWEPPRLVATETLAGGADLGSGGGGLAEVARQAKGHANKTAPVVDDDRHHLVPTSRAVLVVEDDPRFARILHDLAHERGFQALLASTAEEGLALAEEHRPSAVILDIRLPDHTGFSVLDRLKRSPRTRHIPVHVISVHEAPEAVLSMGAVGYLTKPASREQLVEAFNRLESRLAQTVRRVLVVEDDAVQREAVCHLLAGDGVETVPVGTAKEALELLERQIFDCMVLDLGLPDSKGTELLEAMAGSEAVSFPPVIVYTGRSLTSREEQDLRRFSSSIIVKSARSPERLLEEVTLFLHQVEDELPPDRQRMLREARGRDAAFEGKRILVAEDDVRNIFALSSILEPRGAKLEIARNGREAVEALARGPVDLVLMDIMMPEMDGLQAMKAIRAKQAFQRLPIIALTAKAMPDDQARCLEAGANDYLAKPIDVDRLVSLMRVWMPK